MMLLYKITWFDCGEKNDLRMDWHLILRLACSHPSFDIWQCTAALPYNLFAKAAQRRSGGVGPPYCKGMSSFTSSNDHIINSVMTKVHA
jgi:hypothetical protein